MNYRLLMPNGSGNRYRYNDGTADKETGSMMTPRLHARVTEHLETLMAEIRPLPSERAHLDYSYRLNDDAFIVQQHARALEAEVLVANPILKALHSEDPEGWLLYALDADGHWQAYADMVFSADLNDVMGVARQMAGLDEQRPSISAAS